jgi:hypothetical protein
MLLVPCQLIVLLLERIPFATMFRKGYQMLLFDSPVFFLTYIVCLFDSVFSRVNISTDKQ